MKYTAFRESFTASNGAPPRANIEAMMYWRGFVAASCDQYKRLWTGGQLDDADMFVETLLHDATVPKVRRDTIWQYAEKLSGQPVEWKDAPVPAPVEHEPFRKVAWRR